MVEQHADRGHAANGPSSLHRRLACTGSYAAELGKPDKGSSAANEGTRAHELLEKLLRGGNPDGSEPQEMITGVLEAIRWVEKFTAKGYALYVEVAVDPSSILGNPETWGTADIILVKENHLIVADFKYGKYPVAAIGNPQLSAYAAGALASLQLKGITVVTLAILQPRLPMGPTVSSGALTIGECEHVWADMAVKLGRIKSNPTLVPGDHCNFCKARPDCPARLKALDKHTSDAFAIAEIAEKSGAANSVAELTDGALAEMLDRIPLLESVLADVRGEALARIHKGATISGYKIIRGRGGRKWSHSPEDLRKLLKSRGFTKVEMEVIKLVSPAQVEKLDKFKDFSDQKKANVNKLWEKTPGGEQLVTSETRGEALVFNSAEAFAKVETEAKPAEIPSFL